MPKGNPGQPRIRRDVEERFWSKVEKTETCWLWRGSVTHKGRGYPTFALAGKQGRQVTPHRFAWEMEHGPLAPWPAVHLHHVCRNRLCVNPSHLEPVSGGDHNLIHAPERNPKNAQKECVNGHPFSSENTYLSPRGYRQCRTCRRDAMRRFAQKPGRKK